MNTLRYTQGRCSHEFGDIALLPGPISFGAISRCPHPLAALGRLEQCEIPIVAHCSWINHLHSIKNHIAPHHWKAALCSVITDECKTGLQARRKLWIGREANLLEKQFSGKHHVRMRIHGVRVVVQNAPEISRLNDAVGSQRNRCGVIQRRTCQVHKNPPVVDEGVVGTQDSTARGDIGVTHA